MAQYGRFKYAEGEKVLIFLGKRLREAEILERSIRACSGPAYCIRACTDGDETVIDYVLERWLFKNSDDYFQQTRCKKSNATTTGQVKEIKNKSDAGDHNLHSSLSGIEPPITPHSNENKQTDSCQSEGDEDGPGDKTSVQFSVDREDEEDLTDPNLWFW